MYKGAKRKRFENEKVTCRCSVCLENSGGRGRKLQLRMLKVNPHSLPWPESKIPETDSGSPEGSQGELEDVGGVEIHNEDSLANNNEIDGVYTRLHTCTRTHTRMQMRVFYQYISACARACTHAQ